MGQRAAASNATADAIAAGMCGFTTHGSSGRARGLALKVDTATHRAVENSHGDGVNFDNFRNQSVERR